MHRIAVRQAWCRAVQALQELARMLAGALAALSSREEAFVTMRTLQADLERKRARSDAMQRTQHKHAVCAPRLHAFLRASLMIAGSHTQKNSPDKAGAVGASSQNVPWTLATSASHAICNTGHASKPRYQAALQTFEILVRMPLGCTLVAGAVCGATFLHLNHSALDC